MGGNVAAKVHAGLALCHHRIPGVRRLPSAVVGIISALLCVNVVAWAAIGIILVRACGHLAIKVNAVRSPLTRPTALSKVSVAPSPLDCSVLSLSLETWLNFSSKLTSTAVLAYTLGLRHALDADHISVFLCSSTFPSFCC